MAAIRSWTAEEAERAFIHAKSVFPKMKCSLDAEELIKWFQDADVQIGATHLTIKRIFLSAALRLLLICLADPKELQKILKIAKGRGIRFRKDTPVATIIIKLTLTSNKQLASHYALLLRAACWYCHTPKTLKRAFSKGLSERELINSFKEAVGLKAIKPVAPPKVVWSSEALAIVPSLDLSAGAVLTTIADRRGNLEIRQVDPLIGGQSRQTVVSSST